MNLLLWIVAYLRGGGSVTPTETHALSAQLRVQPRIGTANVQVMPRISATITILPASRP